jgi:hypothetical protein
MRVTKPLRLYKSINSGIFLEEFEIPRGDIANYVSLSACLDKINLDSIEVVSPCQFKATKGKTEKITIEYYTEGVEILTSLILESAKGINRNLLYEYFIEFSTIHVDDISREELLEIECFSQKISANKVYMADKVCAENEDIIKLMNSLITNRIPKISNKVLRSLEIPNEMLKDINLFSRSVIVQDPEYIEKTSTFRNTSNISAGLFDIKKLNTMSEELTEKTLNILDNLVESYKDKNMTALSENPLLGMRPFEQSILALEVLYYKIGRIVGIAK